LEKQINEENSIAENKAKRFSDRRFSTPALSNTSGQLQDVISKNKHDGDKEKKSSKKQSISSIDDSNLVIEKFLQEEHEHVE